MSMAIRVVAIFCLMAMLSGCAVNQGTDDLKELFALRGEAEVLYQRGDYRAALAHYQELTIRVPDHTHSWFRLGNCYARLGENAAAVTAYQTALAHDPTFSRAWLNLAYVQAQQLADTVILMYQQVPPGDPQAERIYSLLEGVLEPFGDTLGELPDLSTEGEKISAPAESLSEASTTAELPDGKGEDEEQAP